MVSLASAKNKLIMRVASPSITHASIVSLLLIIFSHLVVVRASGKPETGWRLATDQRVSFCCCGVRLCCVRCQESVPSLDEANAINGRDGSFISIFIGVVCNRSALLV
jgi:hypothetical protein